VLGTRPDQVDRDGDLIAEVASEQELDAASEGWIHAGGFVLVKVAHAGGDSQIVLHGTVPPSASSSSAASGDPGGDTGGDSSDDDGGGCGCRTRPSHGTSTALAVLALMATLAARRRRIG
jgi:MYXO-CTERM domain-containing protein